MELSEFLSGIQDFLNLRLFNLQDTPVTIMSLVIFLFFISAFLIFGSFLRRFMQNRFLKKFNIDSGLRYTLSRVTQ